jgi:hypothetical protein
MVKKTRKKYEVVGAAPVYLEGASGNQAVAVADARLLRVAQGDRQHSLPIDSHDLGIRRRLGNGNPVHSVTSGDVENLSRRLWPRGDAGRESLRDRSGPQNSSGETGGPFVDADGGGVAIVLPSDTFDAVKFSYLIWLRGVGASR